MPKISKSGEMNGPPEMASDTDISRKEIMKQQKGNGNGQKAEKNQRCYI